jgi:hypothetical protein
MKKTEKFIVVRSTESGQFLVKYENNPGTFTYSSTWSEDMQDAATNAIESLERNKDKTEKVAEALGGEILVVNATYELKTLDGKEPIDLTEEIEKAKRQHFENFLRGLLSDNDEEE